MLYYCCCCCCCWQGMPQTCRTHHLHHLTIPTHPEGGGCTMSIHKLNTGRKPITGRGLSHNPPPPMQGSLCMPLHGVPEAVNVRKGMQGWEHWEQEREELLTTWALSDCPSSFFKVFWKASSWSSSCFWILAFSESKGHQNARIPDSPKQSHCTYPHTNTKGNLQPAVPLLYSSL